ncbi:MAG: uracil-DNA glycosylase [Candidatus Omnitrophica bacterium]|nr:uracil-DNA glycosylase [Candidatus Omnitrophota bacterium]MDD5435965.1 uracil-DNA glycosylase [Candidatus Omnitrophota bacterium]
MRIEELDSIITSIKSYLELEKASGVEEFYSCAAQDVATVQDGAAGGLAALRKEVLGCRECDLSRTRTNVVFGAGDPKAKLMFIGEAPGADEDAQGLPFVGRAGQLLTKIIEAMGLKRQDVYIANILKCRPPNNRPPLPTEILACRDNVRRQVEMIKPRVICTLGKFASQTLLGTETPISALRGTFHEYNGTKVMPTFHPAYLLRNPEDKKLVWQDMKKVMKEL